MARRERRATAAFLGGLGIQQIALLPYNDPWEAKRAGLDTARRPLGIRAPADPFLREAGARVRVTAEL